MYYKQLVLTIDKLTSKQFATENEMLISVINELVENKSAQIIGGRIWKLNIEEKGYKLIYQTGKMQKINPNFFLFIKDYPILELFSKFRTFIANETNYALRRKGIFNYTASGIGDKIKIGDKKLYEYMIAFNSLVVDSQFKYSVDIISSVLSSKIKQFRLSASQEYLIADLDKARQLQKSILPEHDYSFYDYELYGLTVPAETVGGDFFDYLEIGEEGDKLGIALGDAASKGIVASAEAMYISGAIRMASSFEVRIAPLFRKMNKLVNKIFKGDKFTSLFYGELSTDKTGLFLYGNAGHNPPMFIKKNSTEVIYLNPTGPVLGPSPNAVYSVENINFDKGDVLLIFSDGIVDSSDEDFNSYGEDRILKLLLENKHLSSKEIALTIMEGVIKYSAQGKYTDDKTIIVIKKK